MGRPAPSSLYAMVMPLTWVCTVSPYPLFVALDTARVKGTFAIKRAGVYNLPILEDLDADFT
ncbi:MAG: hypothetical protein ABI980_12810 [Nitrospirota bacterium]